MRIVPHYHIGFYLMPLRIPLSAACVLLAGALFLTNPAIVLAQDQAAEQAPAEEDKAPDAKEAEQRAEEKRKAIKEYEEAEAKLSPRAGAPECVWTGRRIVNLLWRDDLGTSERYMDLYEQFGCSPEHLKLAFRCVIKQGPLDPKATEELAFRVHNCWILPKGPAKEAGQATTSTKNGTKPK